jgi:hypothetical protein
MSLKIEYDHYRTLSDAIAEAREQRSELTLESYRLQRLTPKRWRWDLLWYCTARILPRNWVCETLYSYLNDDHIDSALRSITNTR